MKKFAYAYITLLLTISGCISNQSSKSTIKISGEQSVKRPAYFLSLVSDASTNFGCGAAYLGGRWAITAAHCAHYPPSQLYVTWANSKKNISNKRIEVSAVLFHEGRMSLFNGPDFALLYLEADIKDTAVKRIHINPTALSEDTEVTVFGRGNQTSIGGIESEDIKSLKIKIQPTNNCKTIIDENIVGNTGNITNTLICAGGNLDTGGFDACQGDSGGPLVYDTGGKLSFLAGIVSFRQDCAQNNQPGFYTKISYFHDWIDEKINKFQNGSLSQEQYRIAFCYTSLTNETPFPVPKLGEEAKLKYRLNSIGGLPLQEFSDDKQTTKLTNSCSYQIPNGNSVRINYLKRKSEYYVVALSEKIRRSYYLLSEFPTFISIPTSDFLYEIDRDNGYHTISKIPKKDDEEVKYYIQKMNMNLNLNNAKSHQYFDFSTFLKIVIVESDDGKYIHLKKIFWPSFEESQVTQDIYLEHLEREELEAIIMK